MANVVHVKQAVLKANRARKASARRAPLTYKKKDGGKAYAAFQVVGLDDRGKEVFRVVYDPEHKLRCGASCYVLTNLKVVPLTRTGRRSGGKILREEKSCQPDCGAATTSTRPTPC